MEAVKEKYQDRTGDVSILQLTSGTLQDLFRRKLNATGDAVPFSVFKEYMLQAGCPHSSGLFQPTLKLLLRGSVGSGSRSKCSRNDVGAETPVSICLWMMFSVHLCPGNGLLKHKPLEPQPRRGTSPQRLVLSQGPNHVSYALCDQRHRSRPSVPMERCLNGSFPHVGKTWQNHSWALCGWTANCSTIIRTQVFWGAQDLPFLSTISFDKDDLPSPSLEAQVTCHRLHRNSASKVARLLRPCPPRSLTILKVERGAG